MNIAAPAVALHKKLKCLAIFCGIVYVAGDVVYVAGGVVYVSCGVVHSAGGVAGRHGPAYGLSDPGVAIQVHWPSCGEAQREEAQ